MSYINGSDYNVTINTPRYILAPMTSKDTAELLVLCQKEGFNYPYIHSRKDTQHLSIEERIQKYAGLGDKTIAGDFGRTLIQTIRPHDNPDNLMGIAVLFTTSRDDVMFKGVNPDTEWEIGAFVDINQQRKKTALESIYGTLEYATQNWGLNGIWASAEPIREASTKITQKLGMEFVELIPAGSDLVPYNDAQGNPAARNVFHTPEGWTLPKLQF